MPSDPHATSERRQGASPLGVLAFVARVLEASVIVFTRTRFGERYLGIQALAVIPWAFVFASYFGDRQAAPSDPFGPGSWTFEGGASQSMDGLIVYLGLWLLALVCARMDVVKRNRSGDAEHSYYGGRPWLFRRLSERNAKSCYEPVLIFAVGAMLMAIDEMVGAFVMFGAAGTLVSAAIAQAQERQRLTDMRDVQIEQRYLAERFREEWRR